YPGFRVSVLFLSLCHYCRPSENFVCAQYPGGSTIASDFVLYHTILRVDNVALFGFGTMVWLDQPP
ncbi:MAG: hypothetical protein JSV55_02415, partial [Deltaproteobacteria bacterium]